MKRFLSKNFVIFTILLNAVIILLFNQQLSMIIAKGSMIIKRELYQLLNSATAKEDPAWRKLACQLGNFTSSPAGGVALDEMETVTFGSRLNAFFLETGCKDTVDHRILCSLESFAYHNPSTQVLQLRIIPWINEHDGFIAHLLNQYKNMKFLAADLDSLFSETPLLSLIKSGIWGKNRDFYKAHLSDLMRVAAVWKYGGIYSDNDMICLTNLEDINDGFGKQEDRSIANGFIKMRQGHPFLMELMEYLSHNYSETVWAINGPIALTRTLESYCHVNSTELLVGNSQCNGIFIYKPQIFYAQHWSIANDAFNKSFTGIISQVIKDSYGFHYSNYITHATKIELGGESIMDTLAKKNCPVTYEHMLQANFTYF